MNLIGLDLSRIDKYRSARSLQSHFKRNYGYTQPISIRINILRVFKSNKMDNLKKWVVRKLINSKDVIGSLKSILSDHKNKGCHKKFLLFCINEFPHISDKLSTLYKTMNTWSIAKFLNSSQTCIRSIYGDEGLGISNRSMRCSKIHLSTKPIIEKLLGNTTITEYYLEGFWIDEFCPIRKVCIEIDGNWCHNKSNDSKRDKYLLSKGYRTFRIPAYSSESEIGKILESIKVLPPL